MPVYLVSFDGPRPKLCEALKAAYPDHRVIHSYAMAINAPRGVSAKDILLNLEYPDAEKDSLVIFQVTADYWGYSKKTFWDWLAASFRSDTHG